jgi:thiosulfate/3-mercaptopyruvate sulfurtransferase
MFKAFGHEKASILDGGLPRWEVEGHSLEHHPPVAYKESNYPTPDLDIETIASTCWALHQILISA